VKWNDTKKNNNSIVPEAAFICGFFFAAFSGFPLQALVKKLVLAKLKRSFSRSVGSRSFSLAKLSFFFFGAFVALRARGFFFLKAIFFLPESKKFLSLPTLLGTTVSLSRI
jgi:hypothetical protein